MRRVITVLAAIAALAASGRAQAAEPGERLTDVQWLERPTGRDVAKLYPPAAALLHIEGEGKLLCRVSAEGLLENCSAVSVSPPGLGFEAAVLGVAPTFKMAEKNSAGRSVVGGEVELPVRFRLPAAQMGRKPPQARSNESLLLGRQLVSAIQPDQQLTRLLESDLDAASAKAGVGAEAAAAAVRQAMARRMPEYRENIASLLAAVLTDVELAEALQFARTPAGELLRPTAAREALQRDVVSDATDQALLELVRLQCRNRRCPPEPSIRPATSQPRSAESLALARDLVHADPETSMLRAQVAQLSAALLESYPGSGEAEQLADTAKLMAADLVDERLAVGLTHLFTDRQLREGVQFYRSSGYVRKTLDIDQYLVGATILAQNQIIDEARTDFCSSRACAAPQLTSDKPAASTRTP